MNRDGKGLTVGFDVTWMSVENTFGGVFQYSKRLISALVEHTDINVTAITGPNGKDIFNFLKGQKNFKEVYLEPPHSLLDVLSAEKIEVVHTPMQIFYNVTFSVPMISTLHDLQHIHYPDFFTQEELDYRKIYYKKSAEFSERVIVSFDHIKKDIVKFYNIPPDKIDVCPLGIDLPKPIDQSKFSVVKSKYQLSEKYLCYSANTWRHKNHMGLIKALKLLHERHDLKIPLVCTGQKLDDYYPEIKAIVDELNLGDFVSFTGYIPEEDMHLLVKNAALVVIPTLYEAGSFPLMEAMAYEVPVICSNVTSLPETIGDDRFVFNPKDTEGMAEKITLMLREERLLEENKENSRKRVREGRWETAVRSFVNSYIKTVEGLKQKRCVSYLTARMHNYELLINKVIKRKGKRINLLEEGRDRLIEEKDRLIEVKDRLIEEKDVLLNSISWKVTRPLRAIGRIFKNKKDQLGAAMTTYCNKKDE